jgi:hypothetical protein
MAISLNTNAVQVNLAQKKFISPWSFSAAFNFCNHYRIFQIVTGVYSCA